MYGRTDGRVDGRVNWQESLGYSFYDGRVSEYIKSGSNAGQNLRLGINGLSETL